MAYDGFDYGAATQPLGTGPAAPVMPATVPESQAMTPLATACKAGDFDGAMALLTGGADPNEVTSGGKTALFFCDEVALVSLLVHFGADVNARDRDGNTPIMELLRTENRNANAERAIIVLIEAGANTEVRNNAGMSATEIARGLSSSGRHELPAAFERGLAMVELKRRSFYKRVGQQRAKRQAWRVAEIANIGTDAKDVFARCLAACTVNDIDALRAHEDAVRASIDATSEAEDANGATMLMCACAESSADVVAYLISLGANASQTDDTGRGALRYATTSWLDPERKIELLVGAGADVNRRSDDGTCALSDAAYHQSVDVARTLLAFGADVASRDAEGLTPLGRACGQGVPRPGIVELLLRCGARATELYERGLALAYTDYAATRDEQGPQRTLLAADALTPRHLYEHALSPVAAARGEWAQLQGRPQEPEGEAMLASLMAKAGIDGTGLDAADLANTLVEHAKDAMRLAYGQEVCGALCQVAGQAYAKDEPLYRALLQAAESDETVSGFLASIICSYALVRAIVEGDADGVTAALEAGADPNARCRYLTVLNTPIVSAARSGNVDICGMLVGAGADVNLAQANSETALSIAAALGDFRMADLLIASGADPNTTTQEGTVLAGAANLAIVMLLLASGTNPNAADADGNTAISHFIDKGRYEIVAALIIMGADTLWHNKQGETPAERAKKTNDATMRRIVVDGEEYERAGEVAVPEELTYLLYERIEELLNFSHTMDEYLDHVERQDPEGFARDRASELERSSWAADALHAGDLTRANDLYADLIECEAIPRAIDVWGWFMVLLMAKDFSGAYLVLKYYHAILTSYNQLLKSQGLLDTTETPVAECFLALGFDAMAVFSECTNCWPFDRAGVREMVRAYGECAHWQDFALSDEEYDSFLRYFLCNDFEEADQEQTPAQTTDKTSDTGITAEQRYLEAEVSAGNLDAYPKLARLIWRHDLPRAIELCEQAIAAGQGPKSTYFLAWLLEGIDRDRSIWLYEELVASGKYRGAANNLANLIKDENPRRAARLYQMAIDAGDDKLATKNLADMIKDTEPERAIGLYERAIEAGNTSAYSALAFMIQVRYPDRAMWLCRKAIEAGEVFNSAYLLGWLLTKRRPQEAIGYLEMAVEAGNHYSAAYALANLIKGQDRQRAYELYRLSANAGNSDAALTLSLME